MAHDKVNISKELQNRIQAIVKEYMPHIKEWGTLQPEGKLKYSTRGNQEPIELDLNEKLLVKIPLYTVQANILYDDDGFSRIMITVKHLEI